MEPDKSRSTSTIPRQLEDQFLEVVEEPGATPVASRKQSEISSSTESESSEADLLADEDELFGEDEEEGGFDAEGSDSNAASNSATLHAAVSSRKRARVGTLDNIVRLKTISPPPEGLPERLRRLHKYLKSQEDDSDLHHEIDDLQLLSEKQLNHRLFEFENLAFRLSLDEARELQKARMHGVLPRRFAS